MAARGLGNLDVCSQALCSGWAVWDGAPATVEIWRNGERVAEVLCDGERSELAKKGLPAAAGFVHYFAETLTLEDQLDVRFPDGTSLPNSTGTRHCQRLGRMLTGIDPAQQGLEFGPLSRALLSRRRSGVRYVDYLTRTELVASLSGPKTAGRIRPELIPEIDHIWKGSPRLFEVVGGGWHYCLASHMIEHAADPIGTLGQFAEVLVPGGRINLAIPNQATSFDNPRNLSRPADLLDAWARKVTRPTFAQVFDHVCLTRPPGQDPGDFTRRVRTAFASAMKSEEGAYVDVHCNVWTPESFQECWRVIDILGLLPLRLAEAFPPERQGSEFIVSLVKT